jgi:hypothetical protein
MALKVDKTVLEGRLAQVKGSYDMEAQVTQQLNSAGSRLEKMMEQMDRIESKIS